MDAQDRVFDIFCIYPTRRLGLLEIAREAGLAHTSVKRELHELAAQGFLTISTETRNTKTYPVYSANLSAQFRKRKLLRNLTRLLECGLLDGFEGTVVLFGSYARGEDVEGSDIDLFTTGAGPRESARHERALGRKISVLHRRDFGQLPAELKNNIVNGIVLKGYLHAFDDTAGSGTGGSARSAGKPRTRARAGKRP